jgi:hypothetical protein
VPAAKPAGVVSLAAHRSVFDWGWLSGDASRMVITGGREDAADLPGAPLLRRVD